MNNTLKHFFFFLKLFTVFCIYLIEIPATAQLKTDTLESWKKGYLDIHFINTGRGNCSFIVMPDGTTMMTDAGDLNADAFNKSYAPMYSPPKFPNASFTAGEAIFNHIKNVTKKEAPILDYTLITHYHGDHYGEVRKGQRKSVKGDYVLTGVTEVGEYIPIKTLLDRAYPNTNFL